jgi:UDP-GlcNAc:undecaprenyl-phosphate/decaprenyl-phosphate GlcNAc-1-phosphate transferase
MGGVHIFFSSAVLTVGLVLVLRAVFPLLGWMDKPERYGYFRKPVPYGLGVVMFLAFFMVSPWAVGLDERLMTLIVGGGVLTLISFLDDRIGLPAWLRLLIQVGVAAAIVVIGDVSVPAITNPLGAAFVLDSWTMWLGSMIFEPLADGIAIFWLVLMMNAMNWLDGVPGMVSGVSTIAFAVIFILAAQGFHVIDQQVLSQMALIFGASTFVFWFFDFPPPRVLMGDSGTMFLGLMLGVLAIYSGAKFATAIIVLAFPVFDFFWTIVRRIYNKQSPLRGDFLHFHHELMNSGMSEHTVCVLFYGFAAIFGGVTLLLESFGKLWVLVALFLIMFFWRQGLKKLKR